MSFASAGEDGVTAVTPSICFVGRKTRRRGQSGPVPRAFAAAYSETGKMQRARCPGDEINVEKQLGKVTEIVTEPAALDIEKRP